MSTHPGLASSKLLANSTWVVATSVAVSSFVFLVLCRTVLKVQLRRLFPCLRLLELPLLLLVVIPSPSVVDNIFSRVI